MVQGYKNTRIQGCKDARIQGYKCSRVHRYRIIGIQGYTDKMLHSFIHGRMLHAILKILFLNTLVFVGDYVRIIGFPSTG